MEIHFSLEDFEYFEGNKARDKEYDGNRLAVKRKLQTIGKKILQDIEQPLQLQTSLHHPYIYNNYRVNSMWLYFCPSKQELKPLSQILGSVLAQDLKKHYQHTILFTQIDYEGITTGLKIHPQAWWDGQHVQQQAKENAPEFLQILKKLKDFTWQLHDWPNKQLCHTLTLDHIKRYFKFYNPGEHWFTVQHYTAKTELEILQPGFVHTLQSQYKQLIPLYNFVRKKF